MKVTGVINKNLYSVLKSGNSCNAAGSKEQNFGWHVEPNPNFDLAKKMDALSYLRKTAPSRSSYYGGEIAKYMADAKNHAAAFMRDLFLDEAVIEAQKLGYTA